MLKRLLVYAVAALSALALAAAAASATFEGEHSGANYKIVVPDAWNGTLVVLAHGYRDKADHPGEVDNRSAMDAGFTAIANGLAAQGYIATTAGR